jgi:aspartate beta-hydroxylase
MATDSDRRERGISEFATQDPASGQSRDAVRNTVSAAVGPPRHSPGLDELARQKLRAGDAAGAHRILVRAVKDDPANPSLWLDLAAALRGLKRHDEEMLALNKVLAIQPRNFEALLQVALLYETNGDSRTSAAIYRTVMQSIPARAELPLEMRQTLQTARAAIDANNVALETFLEERLKGLRARHADVPLGRFDRSMATLLLKRRVYRPQPSFMYFPQLPAIEFFERADFPWLDSIEASTEDIRAELLNVLTESPATLEPYISLPGTVIDTWRELNRSRRWSAYFLWREGVAYPEHLAACPRTVATLEAWPRCDLPGCAPTAMFSILDAKSKIPPHTGVNNCRLVVHVPLIVPAGCGFRVGAETREWEPGKAFVFDDTIEHEAWNDSNDWRAVLILDIWNPYLSVVEREMVSALAAGVDEFYGALPEYIHPAQRTH